MIITSSPGFKIAWNVLKSECFAPLDITTWSAEYVSPYFFLYLMHTAFFRSSIPLAGVYLVKSLSRASFAACLIYSGVGKSGSPAPKPITSFPSAFICFESASIFKVREGDIAVAFFDSSILFYNPPQVLKNFIRQF